MNTQRIMENSVLVQIDFKKLGNMRQGNVDKIETDSDKDRLRLKKVLFEGPEYAAIGKFDNQLRAWLLRRAIQVRMSFYGVYILPLGLLERVERKLAEAVPQRRELVDRFMAVYEQEREQARSRLNGQFREADYPPVQQASEPFAIGWRYVTFEVPETLPPEILERERRERAAALEAMTEDVRAALRESLGGLVSHLVESLTPKPDGKMPKFYDTTVTNLVEFLELFNARNITGDQELASMADRAKDVIACASPAMLRSYKTSQDRVRAGMTEVKKAVDGLIATAPNRRKFNFDAA